MPEGETNGWKVERFKITKNDSAMSLFRYGARAPRQGLYTGLMYKSYAIMSDTDAEQRDHVAPVWNACGNILINGLGLGLVLLNCMKT